MKIAHMWDTVSLKGLASIREDSGDWSCLHQLLNILPQLCTFRQAECLLSRGIIHCHLKKVVLEAFPSAAASGSFLRVFQEFSWMSEHGARRVGRVLRVIDTEQSKLGHDMWVQLFIARTLFELGYDEFWLRALFHAETALLLAGGTLEADPTPADATQENGIVTRRHASAMPHAPESWSTCLVCRAVGWSARKAHLCLTQGKPEREVRFNAHLLILLLRTKNPGRWRLPNYVSVVMSGALVSGDTVQRNELASYVIASTLAYGKAGVACNLHFEWYTQIHSGVEAERAAKSLARSAAVSALSFYYNVCRLFFSIVRGIWPSAFQSTWQRAAKVMLAQLREAEPDMFAERPGDNEDVRQSLRALPHGFMTLNGAAHFARCATAGCTARPNIRCRWCDFAFCSSECKSRDHGANHSKCFQRASLSWEARHFYQTYCHSYPPPLDT